MGKANIGNLTSGGGNFVGVGRVKEAQFNTRSNFGGALNTRVLACELLVEKAGGGEKAVYLTINKFGKKTWSASEDGESAANEGAFLYSDDDAAAINDGTAFGAFLKSLLGCEWEFADGAINADEFVGLILSFDEKDAPTKESADRKLQIVTAVLDEMPGKGDKVKFAKSGELSSKTQKAVDGKKKAKAEPEEEEEEEEAEEDEDEAEEEEADDDADEGIDKETVLAVMAEVMAKNKKGVKLKALSTPVFAAVASKFKKLAGERKAVAAACAEYVESGAKNKVFTYDDETTLISPK